MAEVTEFVQGQITLVKLIDRSGMPFLQPKPTQEQYELLKMLNESGAWNLYRQILIAMKEGYIHMCLEEIETNKVIKTFGTVAGLNLAINQLVRLNDQYVKQQKAGSVSGDPKNHSQQ